SPAGANPRRVHRLPGRRVRWSVQLARPDQLHAPLGDGAASTCARHRRLIVSPLIRASGPNQSILEGLPMALVSENVRVAVTGAVMVGPTSASAPTDADTPPVGFDDLGYISEDGITETRERSTDQLRAWQNADVLREVVTEASISYTFRMVETKAERSEEGRVGQGGRERCSLCD